MILRSCLLFFFCASLPSLWSQETHTFSVFFDYSQYQLRPEAVADLEHLVDLLKDAESYQVQLTGYAGQEGLDEFSQSLSERRAWAVYRYLIRRNLDNGRITIVGIGKRTSIDPNASERVKARSRRVEVKVSYIPHNPSEHVNSPDSVQEEILKEVEGAYSTVFTGPQGTLIRVLEGTFAPLSNEEIRIEIQDFFDPYRMMQEGLSTIDTAGRCLETGGMVFFKARTVKEGREIQPGGEVPLIMEVPSDSFDSGMDLYRAVREDSSIRWAPDTTQIDRNDRDGYLVRILRAGGFNLDKRMLDLPLHDVPPKVLARGYKNPKVFIAHQNKRSWNQLTQTKNRLYENLDGCDCGGQNPVLIAFAEKKGLSYVAEVPLQDLRYQRRKQRYVLQKRFYRMTNDEQGFTNGEG